MHANATTTDKASIVIEINASEKIAEWKSKRGNLRNTMPPIMNVGASPPLDEWTSNEELRGIIEATAETIDEDATTRLLRNSDAKIAPALAAYFTHHPSEMAIRSIWRDGRQTNEYLMRTPTGEWERVSADAAINSVEQLIHEKIYIDGEFYNSKKSRMWRFKHFNRTASHLRSIIKLAGALKPMATAESDIDSHPFLVGLPNDRLFDAVMGEIRQRNPESWETPEGSKQVNLDAKTDRDGIITRQLTSMPAREHSEEFVSFIKNLFPCPLERSYAQCFFGCLLIGQAVDRKILWMSDEGKTGKTALLNAIQNVARDYVCETISHLILDSKGSQQSFTHESAQSQIMDSRGVIIDEVDDAQKLGIKSNSLKKGTGGGRALGRRIGQDTKSGKVKYNIIVASNSSPRINDYEKAIEERLIYMPLQSTPINAANVVSQYGEYLSSQRGGDIAKWICDGMHLVLKHGLPPESTRMMQAKEDVMIFAKHNSPTTAIEAWLEDQTEQSDDDIVSVKDAFNTFSEWMAAEKEQLPLAINTLSKFTAALPHALSKVHSEATLGRVVKRWVRGDDGAGNPEAKGRHQVISGLKITHFTSQAKIISRASQ